MSLADRVAQRFVEGASQEQWEMAAEILAKKAEHEAIKVIKDGYEKVLKAIEEAERQSKGLRNFGAGRTEDPTLILAHVEPAIRDLGENCLAVADQMKHRFGKV